MRNKHTLLIVTLSVCLEHMCFGANPPILLYSTYIGGTKSDHPEAMAIDNAGYILIAGGSQSTNFPITNAYQSIMTHYSTTNADQQDGILMKLTHDGTGILFSTYFGGGSFDRIGFVAVDSSNDIYVAGQTASTNFPVTLDAFQSAYGGGGSDGFFAKFSSTGQLLYASYLGGSNDDNSARIAVDASGNVYAQLNRTASSNLFTTANAFQSTNAGNVDFYVATFDPAFSNLLYASYFGGSGEDRAVIQIDSQTNIYYRVTLTDSTNLPTKNAYQAIPGGGWDTYIAKFDNTQTNLIFATFFGGNSNETSRITLDADNNIYIGGGTFSSDLPLKNAIQTNKLGDQDFFIAKLDSSGSNLLFSTYLGGDSNDLATFIEYDAPNMLYILGESRSTNFPTMDAYQNTNAGGSDLVVMKLDIQNDTPRIIYSTYFGNTGNQTSFGLNLLHHGDIWLYGSNSNDGYPVTNALQTTRAGNQDLTLSRLHDFRWRDMSTTGDQLTFTWDAIEGKSYCIETLKDLQTDTWTNVATLTATNFNTSSTISGTNVFLALRVRWNE